MPAMPAIRLIPLTHPDVHPLGKSFLLDLQQAPDGTRAYIFDVGSNDGAWSKAWCNALRELQAARPAFRNKQVEIHLFEPQPTYKARLEEFVATYSSPAHGINVTFHPFAAWNAETSLTIYEGESPRAWSILDTHRTAGLVSTRRVRAIDFGAFMQRTLPPAGSLSLLKLDVEGVEYTLLPWLLTQGGLCRVRYLLQEWHLNRQPFEQRLTALGFRLAFPSLLQHGCPTPPRAVFNDEYLAGNAAVPIPGLSEALATHSRWSGKPSRWIERLVGIDHRRMRKQPRAAPHCPGGAWRAAPPLGQPAPYVPPNVTGGRPSCYGSCRYEHALCDFGTAVGMYHSATETHFAPQLNASGMNMKS